MTDFLKYELNINQIFTEFSVALMKESWLFYLMAFKKKLKKHQLKRLKGQ
jgi:hypothetical protein